METREIISTAPDGSQVVFTQELRETGWYNLKARTADMNEHLSGSHNTHARLSPSDSKRYLNCTAAIAFQESNAHRVKKDTGSIYADEGTEAHEWAAKVLMGQCTIEEVPELGMLQGELRQPVADYVKHCLDTTSPDAEVTTIHVTKELVDFGMDPPATAIFIEEQVELFYQPEQTGTADFLSVVSENGVVKRFVGRDYKHGAGVLVNSEGNTQLAIYIYSAIKLFEGVYEFGPETEVDLHVFQPRHREGADQSPWVLTLADLATLCKDIEYKAIQVREGANRVREKIGSPGRDVSPEEILEAAPGLRFKPEEGDGGACRWCNCKAFCPKRLSAALEDLDTPQVKAEDMLAAMPDLTKEEKKLPVEERIDTVAERVGLDNLTDDYLVMLYRRTKAITGFLSDVGDYLEGRCLDGDEIPGVKLVMGRKGDRAWADEDAAATFLANQKLSADERFVRTVISPTQAEKLLKDKKLSKRAQTRFTELVTRSPARKVLALADDKRPAVESALASMPDLDEPTFE